MKAFTLINQEWAISEIDILIDTPIVFDEAVEKAVNFELDNIVVPTVSIVHLISMKERAGKGQDKADALYLKKILEDDN